MSVPGDLMLGLSKYEDVRRSTGVTHATLSDRLKHLEDKQKLNDGATNPGLNDTNTF